MELKKFNCWEYKKCERIRGGSKVNEFGICPAYSEERTDEINDGKNGGRACWVITGTLCNGDKHGIAADNFFKCMKCDFYKLVQNQQGKNFKSAKDIYTSIEKS
jgi:hypothetical protein